MSLPESPPAITDDEPLVLAAQKGDTAAFEQLVRRFGRLIYAQLYPEIRDPYRTQDLVQETFLTAWRSLRQLSAPGNFRPWLCSIAQRTLIDSARAANRQKRSTQRLAPTPLDTLAAATPSPDQSAQQREAQQRMLARLDELPEAYRLPLLLRYLAGADHDAIRRQLGLTNGSLRGLLSRGLAMLREKLQETERLP